MLRLNEVLSLQKDINVTRLMSDLGLSKTAFYYNLKNPKLEFLKKVAVILGCDIVELIEPGPGHQHFYDNHTGEWLGIRKK